MLLMLLWLGLTTSSEVIRTPEIEANYRCAKYRIPIDRSRIQQMTNQGPANFITYTYVIEYGDDVVMRISDPGTDVDNIPVMFGKWDYKKRISIQVFFIRNAKKYYDKVDTISFSIEESKGNIEYLCDNTGYTSKCDSVMYSRTGSGHTYLLHFNESLPNIREYSLFYPDVKYLPSKITPKIPSKSIWILEEVLYGKPAVDSILSNYTFGDYDRITEEEIRHAQEMFPIEDIKKLIPEYTD